MKARAKSKSFFRVSFEPRRLMLLLFCITGNHPRHLLSLLPQVHGLQSSPANSNSPKNPSPQFKNNYYSYKTFKRLTVPALFYSVVSKVATRLLHLQPNIIPISNSTTSSTPISSRRRVAIVTGSNTGVGFETAKSLAQEHGMEVIIACRSVEKGIEACKLINDHSSPPPPPGAGNGRVGMAVFLEPIDLANLSSVRRFGKTVMEQSDTIDVLVNNAGRNSASGGDDKSCPRDEDNNAALDIIFTTNFSGHFLLTNLLLKKCRRIVNLSSVMHHFPYYDKHNHNADINSIEYWRSVAIEPKSAADNDSSSSSIRKTYGPSKLAALLFAIELNRRYGESMGIRSIAVNPGAVNSDIWRNFPSYMKRLYRLLYLTAKQGSSTSVAAAVLDDLPPEAIYLQPYRLPPFQNNNNRQKSKASSAPPFPMFEMLGPYAGHVDTNPRLPDDDGAKACECLFAVCEELTGCKFE